MEKETIIELKNIRKEFPGVVALDNVNMKIRASEVHALVGENGAGKSTLMKILSGTYSNYGGSVICKGEEIHMKCEKDAFKYGISIVAQELNYVSELSIAENLFLGREPKKGKVFVNKAERLKETQRLLDEMGLDYNPREKMGNLNVAQRQMIEILKSLSRDSRVIIMDEPTSALTSKESEILFSKVNELKQKGIAFIFISHRLEEVFELCDSYTVLRDGKWIASGDIKDVDTDKLIAMMVGRDIKDIYPPIPQIGKDIRLEVKNLGRKDVFQKVSFQVHKGEIFGLAGMVGAGRSEIVETLFGLARANEGEIILDGKPIKIRSVKDAIQNGIAMVTEDRRTYGFVGVRSISDNIILPNGDLFAKGGIWDKKKVQQKVAKICKRLSVKAPDANTLVGNLSGGNQQKVVLAKWLVRNIKLLILDEPTRGIDVGAKQEIYSLITEFAEQGLAIILISSDMPEVLSMSHRVGVVGGGKMLGILDRNEISCGETMLIVSGMIDLSAGFLCTTSACVSAGVLASTGHLSLALLVGIVIGCVCGWINGFLITYYKLQPFIATLAMTYVLKGIVQIYTNGQTIGGVNKARFLGHGSILGIPVPVLIMLLSVIVIAVLMKSTKFGTYIYAIGGNEQATIASGINTNRTKRLIFTLSGALTGLAGVVLMARLMAGMPSVGEGYEFDAITAVIVGGTSFLGGIGTVTGALIGSIIVGLINNILNLLHVSTQYQLIVKGLLIAIAVIIDIKTKENKKSK